ncbi:MAG: hypothetical protein Q8N34_08075 [Gammaproteobacteria bacterium]|nr:hypothetical protein [Gammaproteobacteria bacterium]
MDPYVQEALNTQNLNRYSYALNSPLAYTDPSGFNFISSLTSYSTDEYGITITQTTNLYYAPIFMGAGIDLMWVEVYRDNFYHVSLPNGVEASGISEVPVGFDVVHAAYDAASAIVNRMEDMFLNYATVNLTNAGRSNYDIGLDKGEAPWLTSAMMAAGMINGRVGDIGELQGFLFEIFSTWFPAILASNVADAEKNACSGQMCRDHDRITVTTWVDGDEHFYQIRGRVCRQGLNCDEAYADRVFAHVNRNDIPFTFDDLGDGQRDLLLGTQPIRHIEDVAFRTSTNIALEGHEFYPGSVTHRVHFENGNLYYDVVGVGSGGIPSFNNAAGVGLFQGGVRSVVHSYGR